MAGDILQAALVPGTPLMVIEIRHVGHQGVAADGAMTRPPGPFLGHTVGLGGDPAQRASLDQALQTVWAAAATVDTGRAAPPFAEGQRSPGSPLSPSDQSRLAAIRSAVDPHGVIRTARV